jgi:hypothetical protein
MSQVKLAEMDAADMLDVIHYIYEEDINYVSQEQAQMVETRRVAIWKSMYNAPYRYTVFQKSNEFDVEETEDFKAFDPTQRSNVKPYFPPTDFSADDSDPFGGVLDAPIGG